MKISHEFTECGQTGRLAAPAKQSLLPHLMGLSSQRSAIVLTLVQQG
jgi:hypothetical protein